MVRAMVLPQVRASLEPREVSLEEPKGFELRLRVAACGVCRTDLHVVDGELPQPRVPVVLGHEVIGTVEATGPDVTRFRPGDRVGVPWLAWTCGECAYCLTGRENLCDRAEFTGYTRNGGYAEEMIADSRYTLPAPPGMTPSAAAPLMCAGLIGYRALRLAGEARRIGFYGFGASAHLTVQPALARGQRVFAFTRPGDTDGQTFARELGAEWAGGSDQAPPEPLDAAILFAPVGALVPTALRAVSKGGTVVCAGIHMSDIPSFPYDLIWGERVVRSVANLTRRDGEEFLTLASRLKIRSVTEPYPLAQANEALAALREGRLHGAAVLIP